MAGTSSVTYFGAFPSSFTPPRLTSTTAFRFRLKPILATASSVPFPSKRGKRKNYLRPKILKTLTKPFPTGPLPLVESLPFVPEEEEDVTLPSEGFDSAAEEVENVTSSETEVEGFSASESVRAAEAGIVGKLSPMSVLKFCGCLVGVFLFQTVCVVCMFGENNPDKKERGLRSLDSEDKRNVAHFDESEVEGRISEIQILAREARETERRQRSDGGGTEGSGIEDEIDKKLVKLEKKLNSKREKVSPDSLMNYLGLFGNVEEEEAEEEKEGVNEDGLGSKEDVNALMFQKMLNLKSQEEKEKEEEEEEKKEGLNGDGLGPNEDVNALMFKKKLKFKSPSSVKPLSNAKGFPGSKDHSSFSSTNGKKASNGRSNSNQNEGNKLEKKGRASGMEIRPGAVQESSESLSSKEVTKAGKSRKLETRNPQGLAKEKKQTTIKHDAASQTTNSSTGSKARPAVNKFGDRLNRQTGAGMDLWWLKLPYLLAIYMRKGPEDEGNGDLYGIRTSQADDQGSSFYTVAFEDRVDANNFCYLLDAFFEDVGDLRADIIPLPTKEVHEAVKSNSKKVIVVKKGQLKLYAGQPLSEVEMALHSMLEENQRT